MKRYTGKSATSTPPPGIVVCPGLESVWDSSDGITDDASDYHDCLWWSDNTDVVGVPRELDFARRYLAQLGLDDDDEWINGVPKSLIRVRRPPLALDSVKRSASGAKRGDKGHGTLLVRRRGAHPEGATDSARVGTGQATASSNGDASMKPTPPDKSDAWDEEFDTIDTIDTIDELERDFYEDRGRRSELDGDRREPSIHRGLREDMAARTTERKSRRKQQVPKWYSPSGRRLYIEVPDQLLARPDLSAGAKLLFADLLNINKASKQSYIAPYQKTLAEAHQVTTRTVRRYMEELEDGWLLERVKRGRRWSSEYHLLDSWDWPLADNNLYMPWAIEQPDGTDLSPVTDDRGRFRPGSSDRYVPTERRIRPHHIEKNSEEEQLTTSSNDTSCAATSPEATAAVDCPCGIPLEPAVLEVYLDHEDVSENELTLGRIRFEIQTSQLHFHPRPAEFLTTQLGLLVQLWEEAHLVRFEASGTRRRKYRGSPITSFDVQRGALLTLERYPSMALTDLVWVAGAPDGQPTDLMAPTPDGFYKALDDRRWAFGGDHLGSAHLDAYRACCEGRHDIRA